MFIERDRRTGGLIALMAQSNMKVEIKEQGRPTTSTMEYAVWKTYANKQVIFVIAIDRPPPSAAFPTGTGIFSEEFTELLEKFLDKYKPCLVMGRL